MNSPIRAHLGFTLIEALVVIMIIGVLLALAAPSFQTFISSQRVKTASFDVYAAMVFARSEAIKRRQSITITPASGDWKNGWTITTPAAVELRKQDALQGVITSGAASVVYRLDGRLTGATVGILIQPEVADSTIQNRCVRIDLTGLPRTSAISDATCP